MPPELSNEQLQRMDNLSREAIDERLRILDNVQRSMWRCTEDLLRVRSILPPRAEPEPVPPVPQSNGLHLEMGDGLASSSKGKEKEYS